MQILNDANGVTRVDIKVCGTRYTIIVDSGDVTDVKRVYYKGTDVTSYVFEVFKDELIAIEDELIIQITKKQNTNNQTEMQFAA